MPSIGGTVTKQELESYGGASIILMSNGNGNVQTGEAFGGETYMWFLAWDSEGFIGIGWGPNNNPDIINNLNTMSNGDKANLANMLKWQERYPDSCAEVTYY